MLLYVTVGTNDPARAGTFYDAALAPLGLVRRQESGSEIGYGHPDDSRCRVWVVAPHDGRPATFGNGVTIALEAANRAAVDAFHAEAFGLGGLAKAHPAFGRFMPRSTQPSCATPMATRAVCERA